MAMKAYECSGHDISSRSYKCMGEMNASHLWTPTLDPNARTLLQVQITHTDEADQTLAPSWATEMKSAGKCGSRHLVRWRSATSR